MSRRILSSCLAFLVALAPAVHAQSVAGPARGYRVLLVGNSLTYTNNLPALLRAVGASQGVSITTETYAAPGGTLSDRLREGFVSAGLRERSFDAVVLQEQGGHLAACMATAQSQRNAPCAASLRAYTELSELARARGAKVLVFATWGPDARWQGRLARSTQAIAERASASVFDAAGVLRALHDAQPAADLHPDGSHPSTQASLMLALALYRDVTGNTPTPQPLRVTAPLLPVNAAVSPASALESQAALAGDGKAVVVPASLIEPLVKALPEANAKDGGGRGRRGR